MKKRIILNKAISLLLVMAFIVGLMPMTAIALDLTGGTFNPSSGQATLKFNIQYTQHIVIEVLVEGVHFGYLLNGDIKEGYDGAMESHDPCNATYTIPTPASTAKGVGTATAAEVQIKQDPEKATGNYILTWNGCINGYPVIGEVANVDKVAVTILVRGLGYPEKGIIPCSTDKDGNIVHDGQDWIWSQQYQAPTTIVVDYRTIKGGDASTAPFLMIKGGFSDEIVQKAMNDLYAGDINCEYWDNNPYVMDMTLDTNTEDPVNMIDGNYIFSYTDLRLEGSYPLTFLRAYNSRYTGGSLGKGFTHGYEYTLKNDDGLVRITLPGGEEIRFLKLRTFETSEYHSMQNSDYTLTSAAGGYLLKHTDGFEYDFSSDGKLLRMRNPLGIQVITMTYTGDLLTKITDVAGSFDLTYNSDKHITQVTDSAARTVTYGYTGQNLTSVTNPDGSTLTYKYDSNGFLNSASDFEGKEYVRNTYDAKGRVTYQVFINANVETTNSFSYDDTNMVNTYTNSQGRETKYYYNEYRNILKVVDADGTVSNTYNNYTADSLTDAQGNSIKYELDSKGNVTKKIYPDGNTLTIAYNANDLIDTVTDYYGKTESYTYNADKSIASYKDKNGNTTLYEYNTLGLLTKETDALGNATTYVYDTTKGRLTSVTDAEGGLVSYTYDAVGRIATNSVKINATDTATTKYDYTAAGKLTKVTDALNNVTSYTYNGNGFTTSTTDALGGVTSTEYGTNGQPLSTTDAMGNKTIYAYNSNGLLSTVTDAEGNATSYTYNTKSLLTKTTDASGNATSYDYDSLDRLVKTTDALGNTKSYTYDSMGRTKTTADENGKTTTYTYNLLGRLTKTTDALGNETNYTYDPNGNLLSTTDANGITTSSEYNALNYTVKSTDGENKSTSYEYDKVGRLLKTTDPLGNITSYTYDLAGNMLTTTDPNGNVTSFVYDLLGRQTKQTNTDGTFKSTVYDALGRVIESYNELSGKTAYAYDKNGSVLTNTDPKGNKKEVFAVNNKGLNASFGAVVRNFKPAVLKITLEVLPLANGIVNCFSQRGFRCGLLRFHPRQIFVKNRLCLFLTFLKP